MSFCQSPIAFVRSGFFLYHHVMTYRNFSLSLAREAGAIIKKNFMIGMKKEWKEDHSPVTATDMVINRLVIDSVKREFPGQSILAEEESAFSETGDSVWVCDPVDGTIPFSHGIPTCVFSLALVRRGVVLLGVIYDPFMDRMFFAEKGKGAFLNGRKIRVSSQRGMVNALFGVSEKRGAAFDVSGLKQRLEEEKARVIDICSITYMGVLVASGELAGTVYHGTKPHDTAALKVIVEEAGGKVTDLFGNDQRYDRDIKGHIISNRILHESLLAMVQRDLLTR
jgi:fructose-1,6-bisphosphatase/inositol monophosphatase family enzyme